VCGHCGSVMERRPSIVGVASLLAGTALLGLSLLAQPGAIDGLTTLAVDTPGLSELVRQLDPPPEPAARPLALLKGDLMDRLVEGDRAWIPTVEPLPDGGIRYSYRRRLGEPAPSLAQLRAMMLHPPDTTVERQSIATLLQELERVGVAIELAPTRKPGAAAEWDHALRTIRVRPLVLEKGTVEFLRVLNHEAIHVAQSCAGGGLRSRPKSLGLGTAMHPEVAQQLNAAMYASSSPLERQLEKEAYANQHRFELGGALVRRHCRPHPKLAMWRISSRHLPA
jgi:hypothetical protein